MHPSCRGELPSIYGRCVYEIATFWHCRGLAKMDFRHVYATPFLLGATATTVLVLLLVTALASTPTEITLYTKIRADNAVLFGVPSFWAVAAVLPSLTFCALFVHLQEVRLRREQVLSTYSAMPS